MQIESKLKNEKTYIKSYRIICDVLCDLARFVQFKSFLLVVFSLVTTEYGDLQIKRPYSVRILGNADQ